MLNIPTSGAQQVQAGYNLRPFETHKEGTQFSDTPGDQPTAPQSYQQGFNSTLEEYLQNEPGPSMPYGNRPIELDVSGSGIPGFKPSGV